MRLKKNQNKKNKIGVQQIDWLSVRLSFIALSITLFISAITTCSNLIESENLKYALEMIISVLYFSAGILLLTIVFKLRK